MADAADDLRLGEVVGAATRAAAVGRSGEGLDDVVPVAKAAQIVRFHRSFRGMADATVLDGATHDLVDGARGPGGLREKVLAVAVRQFLQRAPSLVAQHRWATAERLAASLAPYAAPPPPPGTHPEDFLAAVLAERRERDVARLRADVRRKDALLRRQP